MLNSYVWTCDGTPVVPSRTHHQYYCGCTLLTIISTLRPKQTGRHFVDDIFQMHFLEWEWLYFDSNVSGVCSLRVQLTISQHWFRQWLGAVAVPSYRPNHCWWRWLMPNGVTGTQRVNVQPWLTRMSSGTCFTNRLWAYHLNLMEIHVDLEWKMMIKSCLNFAHVMTAELSWHVQN